MNPSPAAEVARLRRHQRSLHKVVASITSELALEPLLTRIIRHACELLEVPIGCIGLYEEQENAIRVTAARGLLKKRIGTLRGPGVGIAGRVLETRKPVIVDSYAQVKGAWPELSKYNLMGVPILRGRRLIGCFGVGVKPKRTFTQHDVKLLTLFARHASIGIGNAQRFEEQKQRMERGALITRVSRIIAAGLELDDLLRRTVTAIRRVLGYTDVALALMDPDDPGTLVVRASGGDQVRPGYRQSITQGVCGAAVRNRTIEIVADVRADPRYVPCHGGPLGRVSSLAVPIILGRDVLGVINVEGRARFSREDSETLKLVAEHLAPAIRNAAMFEREKIRARRLALISRIGQIAATGLDRDDLLQRAADAVHELLGYTNIDIPIIDVEQPDILVFGARGGEHKRIQFTDRLPVSRGIIGSAVRERRTQLVNDVAKDPRYVTPPLNLKNRAELAVPIVHGGRVLGVLNVEGPGPFDADDAASLQVVADHLAVALHNAQLHEKARQDAVHGERQRLSRDLHDSVTQLLFSLSLLSQSLGPSWRRSSDEGERKAARIVQLAGSALREMRALVGALYPAEVVDEESKQRSQRGSLPVRLRDLSPEKAEGVPNVFFRSTTWVPQSPEVEDVLYRVAQEALTNALKHSRARSVEVLLSSERRRISLTVVDDGRGFHRSADKQPRTSSQAGRGLGLRIMEGRVREQGGRFSVRSSPGRGTTIRVWFDRVSPRS